MMSIRWCGHTACSAALGLAVPMSMSRYTRAESTLMISMGRWAARARAAAVLPLAVGPSSRTAGGRAWVSGMIRALLWSRIVAGRENAVEGFMGALRPSGRG